MLPITDNFYNLAKTNWMRNKPYNVIAPIFHWFEVNNI